MSCNNDDQNLEISGTTACGSDVTLNATCPSSPCSCGCSPCSCSTPSPFYNQAQACQESHVKVCVNQTYTATVKSGAAFNMPGCNVSVSVKVPGVTAILVGSYLWNPTYGYLKITSFDCINEQVTLKNECQLSNASAGTPIPACTNWTVTDPPYDAGDNCGEGVFVVTDFVVPVLGGSVNVDVNTTLGLTIGQTLQVGVGAYQLTAINTPTNIRLLNYGGVGVVPGATISAKDGDGNCITPITPYTADPCDEVAVTSGSLVVCSGGDVATLQATALGQVPVCVDATNNLFESQNAYIEVPECTFITAPVTLISGDSTYSVVVDDSSVFSLGNILEFAFPGLEDVLWRVTAISSGILIGIESVNPNVLNLVISENTQLCKSSCCNQIAYDLAHICNQDWSAAQKLSVDIVWEPDQVSGWLTAGDPTFISDTKTITFTNDTCNTMQVLLTVDYVIQMIFDTNEGSWGRFTFSPAVGLSTAAVPAAPSAPLQNIIRNFIEEKVFGVGPAKCNSYSSYHSVQYHHTELVTVLPNTNLRYDAHIEFSYDLYKAGSQACCPCGDLSIEGSGSCLLSDVNTYIHAIGVAIQAA